MVVAGLLPWYGPGWYWSPYYRMYAFMPGDAFLSPFGYAFYSPWYNPWYFGGGAVIAGSGYGHGWWRHGMARGAVVGHRVAPSGGFRGGLRNGRSMAVTAAPRLAPNSGFRGFHAGRGFAHR
jgi:hypothetical protein